MALQRGLSPGGQPPQSSPETRGWWDPILEVWYKFTALPDVPATAPLAKREAVRRSRLSSIVFLVVILLVLLAFPSAVNQPPYLVILTVVLCIDCFALFVLNRLGKIIAAGVTIVCTVEFGLISSVLATPGGITPADLPLLDLLIQGVCVSIVVLPIRVSWIVPVGNVLFIIWYLLAGPVSPELAQLILVDRNRVITQPVTLIIMVTIVVSLAMLSATSAIRRADRAEEVARLEEERARQQAEQLEVSRQIEHGIEQILGVLSTATTNQDFNARVPLPQENILWRIGRALNNLLSRLQGLRNTYQELEKTRAISAQLAAAIREKRGIPLSQWTGTPMDVVIIEHNKLYPPHTGPATSPSSNSAGSTRGNVPSNERRINSTS